MLVDDESTALGLSMPAEPASQPPSPRRGTPLVRGVTLVGSAVALVSAGALLPLVYLADLAWPPTLGLFGGFGGVAGLLVSFANVVRGESALRNLGRHAVDLTMTSALFAAVVLAANLIAPFADGARAVALVAFYLAGTLFTGMTTQPLVRLMLGGR